MALRYFTAGESPGPGLTAVVDGFPAGVPIDIAVVNRDLTRRMQGYGRGGRMKIERDQAELRSGVRWGESLGSPITLWIENRDWVNWEKKMSPRAEDRDPTLAVTRPRPGHADLAGALKYNHRDVRNVLERARARRRPAWQWAVSRSACSPRSTSGCSATSWRSAASLPGTAGSRPRRSPRGPRSRQFAWPTRRPKVASSHSSTSARPRAIRWAAWSRRSSWVCPPGSGATPS